MLAIAFLLTIQKLTTAANNQSDIVSAGRCGFNGALPHAITCWSGENYAIVASCLPRGLQQAMQGQITIRYYDTGNLIQLRLHTAEMNGCRQHFGKTCPTEKYMDREYVLFYMMKLCDH